MIKFMNLSSQSSLMLGAEGCLDVKLNSVYLEAGLSLSLNGGHYK